jgi:threonylcarbamoyladenosine tRNA methylthiotransferase CDKAL1
MRVPVALGLRRAEGGPATRRVHVEQHGCATTEGEAQVIRGILAARGHALAPTVEEADAVVLVTCTVIETTERAMLRRIREVAATGKDLVVSGCMAGAQVSAIKHAAPGALVLPPAYLHQVGDLLEAREVAFCYQPKAGLPKLREGAVENVVINEGCTGACSFCITKVARPGLRSYPVDAIVEDVSRAVASGAVEVRLTSQDTAAYGLDAGTDLAALLRAVCAVEGDFRVRVGMLNPFALAPVLDDLLDAFAHPKVFKFLHLPVQSGSARVLAAMRRGHRVDDVVAQVDEFRARFPDLFLATDAIVGFPGETDAEFEETVALLRRMDPDVANVTRFSAREGTPAAALEGQLHGRVLKARSRILTRLREELGALRFGAWVGREVDVVVTEPGKPGTVLARTDAYRQVVLPERALGTRGEARVTGATPHFLFGEWA